MSSFGDTSVSVAFDVTHDDTPPAITFLSPTDLAVLTRSPVRVQLTATDALRVASVSVTRVPAAQVNGVWEMQVPVPLGDSYLVATAEDALGNLATRAIAVTYVVAEGAGYISAATGGTAFANDRHCVGRTRALVMTANRPSAHNSAPSTAEAPSPNGDRPDHVPFERTNLKCAIHCSSAKSDHTRA